MSAKLRSFLDYLRSPWRLWRRGRRLPARVQVTALAGVVCSVALAITVWTVARARPQEEGGGEPSPVDPQDRAVYERVHALRTAGDAVGARAAALEYLETHPEPSAARQLVHYEYGATFYGEGRKEEALGAFQEVVNTYGGLGLDAAAADCKVDDAQFFVGVLHNMLGHLPEASAAYMAVCDLTPASDRAAAALKAANVVLFDLEKASVQDGAATADYSATIEGNIQRLVTQYPDSPACGDAFCDLLDYVNDRAGREPAKQAGLADELAAVVAQMRTVPAGQARIADGVRRVNNALIWQEHASCFAPDQPVKMAAAYDHAPMVKQNVQSLVAEQPADPQTIEALARYAEYLLDRTWRGGLDGPDLEVELRSVLGHVQGAAPDSDQAWFVRLQLAEAIGRFDAPRAVEELDAIVKDAATAGRATYVFNGSLSKAHVLSFAGHDAEARVIWQAKLDEVLRGASPLEPGGVNTLITEAELRSLIAHSYVSVDGDSLRAIAGFEEIANAQHLPRDFRAMSLYHKAFELKRLGRDAEIPAVIEEIKARFPDTSIARQIQRKTQ